MDEQFHLAISYQEDVPRELLSPLLEAFNNAELIVKEDKRPRDIYAALEWALPTVIIAYLTKPYFEAMLKEAGKEHYHLLKAGFLNMFEKIFGTKQRTFVQRSNIFSLLGDTQDGKKLKCIFPEGIEKEQYSEALDELFELITTHHKDYPNDPITKMAEQLENQRDMTIYIEFNTPKKLWIILDPSK